MLPDRVSNPGPMTYESDALPISLRGPAFRRMQPVVEQRIVGRKDEMMTNGTMARCTAPHTAAIGTSAEVRGVEGGGIITSTEHLKISN